MLSLSNVRLPARDRRPSRSPARRRLALGFGLGLLGGWVYGLLRAPGSVVPVAPADPAAQGPGEPDPAGQDRAGQQAADPTPVDLTDDRSTVGNAP